MIIPAIQVCSLVFVEIKSGFYGDHGGLLLAITAYQAKAATAWRRYSFQVEFWPDCGG